MNIIGLTVFLTAILTMSLAAQEMESIDLPNEAAAEALSKELIASAEHAGQRYASGVAHGEAESARLPYVTSLAQILFRYLQIDKGFAWKYLDSGCGAVYNELARHPAPKDSDSKTFSRLLVGKWRSPRHDYTYRRDGSWRIEGNHLIEGGGSYTIILLNKDYFIFTGGHGVNDGPFFEKRIAK